MVTIGSELGATLADALKLGLASEADLTASRTLSAAAARAMGRQLDPEGLREALYEAAEHPHWNRVAERCLTCASCTLVCPTCFCSRMTDRTSLDGATAERSRSWDSCFSLDHSYMHGGVARSGGAARYRQWLTHKLPSWIDQFGTSGCVGCGGCIAWCPAGIDITEEAAALREEPLPPRSRRL